MNTKTIVAIAAILVVLGAGYAVAAGHGNGFWSGMMGYGNGVYGHGYWMMGGHGGMMGGYGNGMMGYGSGYRTGHGMMGGYSGAGYGATNPITIDEAKKSVEQYLASTGNPELVLAEVIDFDNNFYAGVKENGTGKYAFELLVNNYTGAVFPEMGPNMMWNTKYGRMGWNTTSQTTVTKEQALGIAQNYLDGALPGTKTGDADEFYGYYTIEVTKDTKIYGMLSVNSYTGDVWYHNWHGAFVKMLEVE
jgi:hypothetical protein